MQAEAEIARLTREIDKLDMALADGELFTRDTGEGSRDRQGAIRERQRAGESRRGLACRRRSP